MIVDVDSNKNPTIRRIRQLLERQHFRRKSRRFVVEGRREVERAREAKVHFLFYLVSEDYARSLPSFPPEDTVYRVSAKIFSELSRRDSPDGVIGVASTMSLSLADLQIPEERVLLLLAESIEKPGNLGSLVRSAEAAGVHAVLLAEPLVDAFHPSAIRNSQGAVFGLPVVATTNREAAKFLKNRGMGIFAATPHADTFFWNADCRPSLTVCVGSESRGLSEFWLSRAQCVKIPMYGRSADSLNVHVSATLLLYEVARQRHFADLASRPQ